jgi:hypothetical protein
MPNRFGGRQRPHFVIVDWVQFGGNAQPALNASQPGPAPLAPLKSISAPSLKEQMGGDEVPFNDNPDLSTPKNASAQTNPDELERILDSDVKKPAAPQKPTINKKGVQKVAGGHR